MSYVDFRQSLLNWAEKHQFKLSNSFVNSNDTFSIYHALFDDSLDYQPIEGLKAMEGAWSMDYEDEGPEFWYEDLVIDCLENILDNSWQLSLCEFLDDDESNIQIVLTNQQDESYDFVFELEENSSLSGDFLEEFKQFSLEKTNFCITPIVNDYSFRMIGLTKEASGDLDKISDEFADQIYV